MKPLLRYLSILICIFVAGCAITHKYGPYYGKVVDLETGEPIEGAVVLVVFYTESPGPAGSISYFADAVEVVTDKNGEFRIPATRVLAGRFLQVWDPYGYVTIFKPGYGCYPDSPGVKPMFDPNGTLPENQFVIIKLPKLKTKKERKEFGIPSINGAVPYEKQKTLISLINKEREFLGYSGKIEKKAWELLENNR